MEKEKAKKKEEEKEVQIERVYVEVPKKENKAGKFFKFLIFLIIIGLIGYALIKYDMINLPSSKKKSAELNYTETTTKIKEGIYLTDVSEIVDNVMPSIVAITSKTLISSGQYGPSIFGGSQEYTAEGAGSGIIISKTDSDILILTNYHVIEGAEELSVTFYDEKSYDAKVVGVSEKKDIAVIKVALNDIKPSTIESIAIATIGDSNKLKVGNGIIAIGNALGYGQSVTTGVVSALNREVTMDNTKTKMIQIDAAINGGNSGGALLNAQGEVVGINSVKYSAAATSTSASIEGMGFAIPISDVKDLINQLMNGEDDLSGGTIGVEGFMTTDFENTSNLPKGFYIQKITKGSGADKAELEIGNIITEIDGKKVEEFSVITEYLDELKKGDEVQLTIAYPSGREYKEKTVKVKLS
ncbi:MAG: trypsin-like peptidase domain-containing protein [Bacilli bacterium]|nr:trypsin-like peptidase domain-containing protein [Bacilli bacterium]